MRYDNSAMFSHVSRELFNRVADRLHEDDLTRIPITVRYNGTDLYGDVEIDAAPGNSKAYKKALQVFVEEYCK